MTGLYYLLNLAFFVFLGILIYAFFRKTDRKKFLKIGGIGAGICFVAATAIGASLPPDTLGINPDQDAQTSNNFEAPVTEVGQPAKPVTQKDSRPTMRSDIGLTTAEFDANFNQTATEFGLEMKSKADQVDYVATGQFDEEIGSVNFTKTFALSITRRSGNSKIVSVIAVATGDGQTRSGVDGVLGIGAVISAVEPNLSAKERGDIIMKALETVETHEEVVIEKYNLEYRSQFSQQTGLLFSVERAE